MSPREQLAGFVLAAGLDGLPPRAGRAWRDGASDFGGGCAGADGLLDLAGCEWAFVSAFAFAFGSAAGAAVGAVGATAGGAFGSGIAAF